MASLEGTSEVPLGTYIFERIRSLGIEHVFGVPGDFNLNLLDHMSSSNIQWVGTCNELNAAYAADGYARVRGRGLPGVLVTTYGVGELSAINGIAGAYAEHVPIIHIVGMTSRLQQKGRMMIHHTLGQQWDSADHSSFMEMSKPVRTDSCFLEHDETFAQDVDRVLETCFKTRRPVYIYVPMDTPDILIPSDRLKTPLDVEIRNKDAKEEEKIVQSILTLLKNAKSPTALVDVLTRRYGLEDEITELLKITNLPAFTTPLSKALVDETSPNFAGIYVGQMTPNTKAKEQLESSDMIMYIGPLPSDSSTGGFSYGLPAKAKITLHSDFVSIGEEVWEGVHFVPIIKKLVVLLRSNSSSLTQAMPDTAVAPNGNSHQVSLKSLKGPLQQHYFWKSFEPYLHEGDCIIAEVGTAQFATLDLSLPPKAEYFTQIFYSCIGFTVGALLGALVARRERGHQGRVLLFVGDGSLQMTVQELGTIIRQGFNPIIVLINNSGYTVERVIHGPTRAYNDISETWDYQSMLKFFGATSKSKSYTARTYEELHTILENPAFAASEHIQLLEAFMDKYDAPWNMLKLVQVGSERAAAGLKKWDEQCGRRRVVKDVNLMQSNYVLKDSPSYRKAVE